MSKKITYKNLIVIIMSVLIITGILIVSLIKTYDANELGKFINDMSVIHEKVSYINSEYLLWENYDPNEAGNFSSYLQSKNFINASSASNIYIDEFQEIIENFNDSSRKWDSNLDQILSNYCYFTPSAVLENFGIENPNYYIIINFYTGNIICKNGIKNNGKTYYRHYDLDEYQVITNSENTIIPQVQIVQNSGLNKRIKVLLSDDKNVTNIAEVYYLIGDDDEDKKRCTELSDYQYIAEEKTAYFTVNTSGKYGFIVEDTNCKQYPKVSIEIALCNSPILENDMQGIYFDENNNEIIIENMSDANWYNYSEQDFKPAYAKKTDGSYWVWIPRFIFRKIQDDIKIDFVYNISQTSTTNKSTINYNLPKAFEKDVSGIWINEKNLNYYNVQSTDFFKKVLTNQ